MRNMTGTVGGSKRALWKKTTTNNNKTTKKHKKQATKQKQNKTHFECFKGRS